MQELLPVMPLHAVFVICLSSPARPLGQFGVCTFENIIMLYFSESEQNQRGDWGKNWLILCRLHRESYSVSLKFKSALSVPYVVPLSRVLRARVVCVARDTSPVSLSKYVLITTPPCLINPVIGHLSLVFSHFHVPNNSHHWMPQSKAFHTANGPCLTFTAGAKRVRPDKTMSTSWNHAIMSACTHAVTIRIGRQTPQALRSFDLRKIPSFTAKLHRNVLI